MVGKKTVLVWLLAALSGLPAAFGQNAPGPSRGEVILSDDSFLEQLQKRDSVLIGDQLRYGFHLRDVPRGTALFTPDLSKGFMPGDSVEVISSWKADTVKVYGNKRNPMSYDIDFSVVITSFEEGKYLLAPLSVFRQSAPDRLDTLIFKPRPLEVFTMPVDTSTYEIHDIKGQIRYPVTLSEILPFIVGAWLVAILCILVWALLGSRRRASSEEAARRDPPYIVALRKLESFRSDKYWERERQKTFYSGITDALREYIDSRYGIDAPEMTTAELFESLKKTDVPKDLLERMKDLFETADLVKFAKAFASEEENASAVPDAVRFVTSTYIVEPEAPSGKEQGGSR